VASIHGKLPVSISSDSRNELRERYCVTILRIDIKSLNWNKQAVDEQGLGEKRIPARTSDPARRPPAFSIVHTDREPGTGFDN